MPNICWCKNEQLDDFTSEYYVCRLCGTLVSKKDYSDDIYHVQDEDNDLYGDHYWNKYMVELAGVSSMSELITHYLSHRALHWLKYFLWYCLPPINVAEIGGGLGQFSYLLRLAGFKQTEYELSPNICEYSRKELGINAICGDFCEAEDLFESIVAFDLIEHIIDPARTIGSMSDRISDDGILCIQTPYYNATLSYDEIQKQSPHFSDQLKPEQHIYLFSKKAIEKLLASCGFLHIEFLPAVFGDDYDMFLVASKKPLKRNSNELITKTLSKFGAGHFILAVLELYEKYQKSEVDREARLNVIYEIEARLNASEADREARLNVIQDLEKMLNASEVDREAKLNVIQDLEKMLNTSEADRETKQKLIDDLSNEKNQISEEKKMLIYEKEEFFSLLAWYYDQWNIASNEKEQFNTQYNLIINSTSWRVTRPLRFIVKVTKAAIKFCLPYAVVRYIQIKKYGQ